MKVKVGDCLCECPCSTDDELDKFVGEWDVGSGAGLLRPRPGPPDAYRLSGAPAGLAPTAALATLRPGTLLPGSLATEHVLDASRGVVDVSDVRELFVGERGHASSLVDRGIGVLDWRRSYEEAVLTPGSGTTGGYEGPEGNRIDPFLSATSLKQREFVGPDMLPPDFVYGPRRAGARKPLTPQERAQLNENYRGPGTTLEMQQKMGIAPEKFAPASPPAPGKPSVPAHKMQLNQAVVAGDARNMEDAVKKTQEAMSAAGITTETMRIAGTPGAFGFLEVAQPGLMDQLDPTAAKGGAAAVSAAQEAAAKFAERARGPVPTPEEKAAEERMIAAAKQMHGTGGGSDADTSGGFVTTQATAGSSPSGEPRFVDPTGGAARPNFGHLGQVGTLQGAVAANSRSAPAASGAAPAIVGPGGAAPSQGSGDGFTAAAGPPRIVDPNAPPGGPGPRIAGQVSGGSRDPFSSVAIQPGQPTPGLTGLMQFGLHGPVQAARPARPPDASVVRIPGAAELAPPPPPQLAAGMPDPALQQAAPSHAPNSYAGWLAQRQSVVHTAYIGAPPQDAANAASGVATGGLGIHELPTLAPPAVHGLVVPDPTPHRAMRRPTPRGLAARDLSGNPVLGPGASWPRTARDLATAYAPPAVAELTQAPARAAVAAAQRTAALAPAPLTERGNGRSRLPSEPPGGLHGTVPTNDTPTHHPATSRFAPPYDAPSAQHADRLLGGPASRGEPSLLEAPAQRHGPSRIRPTPSATLGPSDRQDLAAYPRLIGSDRAGREAHEVRPPDRFSVPIDAGGARPSAAITSTPAQAAAFEPGGTPPRIVALDTERFVPTETEQAHNVERSAALQDPDAVAAEDAAASDHVVRYSDYGDAPPPDAGPPMRGNRRGGNMDWSVSQGGGIQTEYITNDHGQVIETFKLTQPTYEVSGWGLLNQKITAAVEGSIATSYDTLIDYHIDPASGHQRFDTRPDFTDPHTVLPPSTDAVFPPPDADAQERADYAVFNADQRERRIEAQADLYVHALLDLQQATGASPKSAYKQIRNAIKSNVRAVVESRYQKALADFKSSATDPKTGKPFKRPNRKDFRKLRDELEKEALEALKRATEGRSVDPQDPQPPPADDVDCAKVCADARFPNCGPCTESKDPPDAPGNGENLPMTMMTGAPATRGKRTIDDQTPAPPTQWTPQPGNDMTMAPPTQGPRDRGRSIPWTGGATGGTPGRGGVWAQEQAGGEAGGGRRIADPGGADEQYDRDPNLPNMEEEELRLRLFLKTLLKGRSDLSIPARALLEGLLREIFDSVLLDLLRRESELEYLLEVLAAYESGSFVDPPPELLEARKKLDAAGATDAAAREEYERAEREWYLGVELRRARLEMSVEALKFQVIESTLFALESIGSSDRITDADRSSIEFAADTTRRIVHQQAVELIERSDGIRSEFFSFQAQKDALTGTKTLASGYDPIRFGLVSEAPGLADRVAELLHERASTHGIYLSLGRGDARMHVPGGWGVTGEVTVHKQGPGFERALSVWGTISDSHFDHRAMIDDIASNKQWQQRMQDIEARGGFWPALGSVFFDSVKEQLQDPLTWATLGIGKAYRFAKYAHMLHRGAQGAKVLATARGAAKLTMLDEVRALRTLASRAKAARQAIARAPGTVPVQGGAAAAEGLSTASLAAREVVRPIARGVRGLDLPYRVRKSLGVRLSRTLATRARYVSVHESPILRQLRKLPGLKNVTWEQHHVFLQQRWFKPGGPSAWYAEGTAEAIGLRELGHAGWNLMPVPRALNQALGRSPWGTLAFGTGVVVVGGGGSVYLGSEAGEWAAETAVDAWYDE